MNSKIKKLVAAVVLAMAVVVPVSADGGPGDELLKTAAAVRATIDKATTLIEWPDVPFCINEWHNYAQGESTWTSLSSYCKDDTTKVKRVSLKLWLNAIYDQSQRGYRIPLGWTSNELLLLVKKAK